MDAGGVTKEFFLLLLKELMDPVYGMFTHYKDSNLLWFSDKVSHPDLFFFLLSHSPPFKFGFHTRSLSKAAFFSFVQIHISTEENRLTLLLKRSHLTMECYYFLDQRNWIIFQGGTVVKTHSAKAQNLKLKFADYTNREDFRELK